MIFIPSTKDISKVTTLQLKEKKFGICTQLKSTKCYCLIKI